MTVAWQFQKVHEHLSNILHLAVKQGGERQDTFPRANFTDVCIIVGNFTYFNLPDTVNVSIVSDNDKVVVKMVKL